MTDDDLPRFGQAIGRLGIALREPMDTAGLRIYFDALKSIDVEFIIAAADRLITTTQWFPKPAEWITSRRPSRTNAPPTYSSGCVRRLRPCARSATTPDGRRLARVRPNTASRIGGFNAVTVNGCVGSKCWACGRCRHCQPRPTNRKADPPDLSRSFTMIIPNMLNDMHMTDLTPDIPSRIKAGDDWLRGYLPKLLATPEYRAGKTVIVITWDEGQLTNSNIPLFVLSPFVNPGARETRRFDHYSLLRTMQEMLGLGPFLGNAAGAASMRGGALEL
jgi:hypothetical protein